jgi:neutral ceramidase
MLGRFLFLSCCAAMVLMAAGCASSRQPGQTPAAAIGVAKIDITPDTPVRMYGYASRKTESEGVAQRLHASALVIGEDGGDGPAVLLSVDNGSVPTTIRDEVLRRLQAQRKLKPERFMLCNTHIHSGPNLEGMKMFTGEHLEHMQRYADQLTSKLEVVVLKALEARRPGRLDWAVGSVGFATNRRVLKDGKWSGFGLVPEAPADHSLPVLRVTDSNGKLMALFVNYACHDTTLRPNFKQLHADWAGCAQEFIEADNPGAVAVMALGCGADSDPGPYGTVELCQEHGREVSNEVKRLLAAGQFKPIDPAVTARLTMVEIPYAPLPPADELKAYAAKTWSADQTLKMLEEQKTPPARKYAIATWTFGNDLAMVFLSNEVVVDYALRLKREFDPGRMWVNAYSNEVEAYIPSDRLVGEGGYEVNNSLSAAVTYGHAERLQPTLETRIVEAVRAMLPAGFRAPMASAQ